MLRGFIRSLFGSPDLPKPVIHLTQVTPRYSVRPGGELSQESGGVRAPVCDRRGLPGLSRATAMAGWVSVPGVRARPGVARSAGAARVRPMRASGIGDGRDDLSGHPNAPHHVVPGDVVGHRAEDWHERARAAVGLGAGQLQDGVELAPETAARDGATGARSVARTRRSRRDVLGRQGSRSARPATC